MTEERILKTTLKFTVSDTETQKSADAARKISKEVGATRKAADEAGKSIDKALAITRKWSDEIEKSRKRYEEALQAVNKLRESSERLGSAATSIGLIGAAITGPLVLAAKGYVTQAGQAEVTSRKWLKATESISKASSDIGRVTAKAILPYLEQAADLAQKAADFVEKNPDVISTALKIGAAVTAVGAVGLAVSKGIRLYADVKTLALGAEQIVAAKMMQQAAATQLAAAGVMSTAGGAGGVAGGAAKALGGAALVGSAGGAAILGGAALFTGAVANYGYQNVRQNGGAYGAKLNPSMIAGAGETLQKTATIAAYGLGAITDKLGLTSGATQRWTQTIGKLTGAIKGAETATEDEADAQIASVEDVTRFIQFKQEEAQAEQQYGEDRSRLVEQYAKQRSDIEANYEKQRTNIVESFAQSQSDALADYNSTVAQAAQDYAKSEREAEEQYYKERSEAAKNYNIETQRAEEDHQRAMRELQRDHNDRMNDLIGSRDALAIVDEMRSYERQRQTEEENYRVEAARRSEDYAMQLADMEQSFADQRQQRLDDYQQRLQDEQQSFQEQQAEAQQAYNEQLQELDNAHREELRALESAKADELRTLEAEYQKQKQARATALADEYRLMQEQLNAQNNMMSEWWAGMTSGWQGFVNGISSISSELPGFTAPAAAGTAGTPSTSAGQSKKGRAGGGYAQSGIYTLGERGEEFVLNNQTTRLAEHLLGQRLTQDKMLSAMAGSFGSSSNSSTVNITMPIGSGTLTVSERRRLLRSSRDAALSGLAQALEGVL